MSERMIELQRQKILAAGKGPRANAAKQQQQAQQQTTTLQQRAAEAIRTEDEQLANFLERLAHRDDSREGSHRVPTVPTAMTRRILNRQGVGFLDPTIAAMVSAAADRFLVTVMHQAAACRDQRLKGAEVQRAAAMARKRHLDQVDADRDDRERRKTEQAAKREAMNRDIMSAAEILSKKKGGAASGDKDGASPKSKKKKKADDATANNSMIINGSKIRKVDRNAMDEDEERSVDSIDEEEDYYKSYYGDEDNGVKDDDEEDDEALILRDFVHPLGAWDFTLEGKLGLLPVVDSERSDSRTNADGQVGDESERIQETGDDAMADDDLDSDDDDGDGMDTVPSARGTGASSGSRKLAASPVPPSSDKNDKVKKSPSVPPSARNSPVPKS